MGLPPLSVTSRWLKWFLSRSVHCTPVKRKSEWPSPGQYVVRGLRQLHGGVSYAEAEKDGVWPPCVLYRKCHSGESGRVTLLTCGLDKTHVSLCSEKITERLLQRDGSLAASLCSGKAFLFSRRAPRRGQRSSSSGRGGGLARRGSCEDCFCLSCDGVC